MLQSISQLSVLTGKARETITKRLENISFTKDGKSKLFESVEALPLIYDLDSQSAYDLQAERARLSHHQANCEALREKQLRKELIPVNEVEEQWTKLISNFRAKMLSLPTKTAHRIAQTSDHAEIEEILKIAVHDSLLELANE